MLSGGEPTSSTRYDKPLPQGSLQVGVTSQYLALTRLVHGDDYISFAELGTRAPEAAEHGDADMYVWQTTLSLRYTLSEKSELSASLPFRSTRMSVDKDDNHHRDQTYSGLGDLRLGIRHFLVADEQRRYAVNFGLSLPTGRRNKLTAAAFVGHEEAEELGIVVPSHSHMRLGTGTADPFVGVDALYRLPNAWTLLGSAEVSVPFYDADDGYRTATRATAAAGIARTLGASELTAALFAKLNYAGRDEFHGDDLVGSVGSFSGNLDVPNTGRLEVSLQPSITWRLADGLTAEAQINVPVYTKIHEDADGGDVQLSERAGVVLRMVYAPTVQP